MPSDHARTVKSRSTIYRYIRALWSEIRQTTSTDSCMKLRMHRLIWVVTVPIATERHLFLERINFHQTVRQIPQVHKQSCACNLSSAPGLRILDPLGERFTGGEKQRCWPNGSLLFARGCLTPIVLDVVFFPLGKSEFKPLPIFWQIQQTALWNINIYFSQTIDWNVSCKLFLEETICMKY